jgi:hypothetical protein
MTSYITPDFQSFHLLFERFSQKLSEGLQTELEKLVQVMSRCYRSTINNDIEVECGTAEPIYNPGFPDSKGSIRRMYRDGIIKNLPCPHVHTQNEHAFVKLREVVAHHLGHGKDVDFFGPHTNATESVPATVRSLAESKQASKILRAAYSVVDGSVLPLWIVLWSDDFEPNTLLQNRGSVWVLTATICTPNESSNSASNTYVLAIGPKGDDHNFVFTMVALELKFLSSGGAQFYHANVKGMINVYGEVIAYLMDSPERRGTNKLMLGTGTYTHLWLHAGDFTGVERVLPSCRDCFVKMLSKQDMSTPCLSCANWEIMHPLIVFPVPTGWPVGEQVPGRDGKLPFVKHSFPLLKEVILKAHNGFVDDNGNWPLNTCRVFLKVYGINERTSDEIMDHAMNAITLKDAIANMESHPDRYDAVLQDYNENPGQYERWCTPCSVGPTPH